ncbi:plasmid mobilization protein [Methylovulum psychrotolerans]|uniref:Uncharacterized protein n=1 Tax=Methylovulum psychrotolerans TaxID=1704499 RepID=A0A2S5CFU5_9GAMM|nr:hypothetical protein [Methylovulum psychrotolerans]POZ49670.1 hypothetical protein AADEFJLK_04563 [Methylovulum psychrotolerans]
MTAAPKRRKPQGIPPSEVRAEITRLYQTAANGTELAAALTACHYALTRSTRRAILVTDPQGGEHNLLSRIAIPREEALSKLADLNPDSLPLKKSREREAAVKCFLTPAEKSELISRADQAELSLSGYIRALIFANAAQQPKASRRPMTDKQELVKLRQELRTIGGHLSELAAIQHPIGGFDNKTFAELCSAHENALKAILSALSKP